MGASVSMELGCAKLPACGRLHQPRSSLGFLYYYFYTTGIFTEASSHRHDQSLTPFRPFASLWRARGGTENCKLLLIALSFS